MWYNRAATQDFVEEIRVAGRCSSSTHQILSSVLYFYICIKTNPSNWSIVYVTIPFILFYSMPNYSKLWLSQTLSADPMIFKNKTFSVPQWNRGLLFVSFRAGQNWRICVFELILFVLHNTQNAIYSLICFSYLHVEIRHAVWDTNTQMRAQMERNHKKRFQSFEP